MANTLRKAHDKSTLIPQLQVLIPEELKNEKTFYIIHNSPTAGIDQVVKNYLEKELATEAKKAERRSPSDAVRVVGICLLDKYRDAFNYWQQNKKTRFDLDLPVSLNDGFMHEGAKDFNDLNVILAEPRDANQLNLSMYINPNDPTRIAIPRDAKWFEETLNQYVLAKYKAFNAKYSGETGHGSAGISELKNYATKKE